MLRNKAKIYNNRCGIMKNQLQKELADVCGTINDFIFSDSFPDSLVPELLRDAVRLYPLRGGKRIRPVLVMWSCGAVGGDPVKAVNAAAAVEIYHNWTLVHDDIIDCDELRRGKETCHIELKRRAAGIFGLTPARARKYGTDFAILAGDVQQAWAMDVLLRSADAGISCGTVNMMARRMQSFLNRELISGEALDVEFEYRKQFPGRDEVLNMIRGKTGALLSFSAECGAMIGLDTPDFERDDVRALSAFAGEVGYAFQLCDDLLGVYGDAGVFGKPLCSDFREGKPTVLFIEALERLSEDGKNELFSLMNLERYGAEEISRIQNLLEECGARAAVIRQAESSSVTALKNLSKLPGGKYRSLLEALAESLLNRNV